MGGPTEPARRDGRLTRVVTDTTALTPEGFDADRIRAFLEDSDLNALQKQAVDALITQAEENPDQIQALAEQIRSALGL